MTSEPLEVDIVRNPKPCPPHTILLGAGASIAACPGGDRGGKALPVMNNLVSVLDLAHIFEKRGINYDNFEAAYSELVSQHATEDVRLVEEAVYGYFDSLRLPQTPTVYDYLVLSFRPKDTIATFNWDPLLIEAARRNFSDPRFRGKEPQIAFLHGNTGLGYCPVDRIKTSKGRRCPKCGNQLQHAPLLYPLPEKNYVSNQYTESAWRDVPRILGLSFVFTVFGYSAPVSDTAAIQLLQEGWFGNVNEHDFEEIEVIDIRPEEEVAASWQPFTSHDYPISFSREFLTSVAGRHPRRSVEAAMEANQYGHFSTETPIQICNTLDEMRDWFAEIAKFEESVSTR